MKKPTATGRRNAAAARRIVSSSPRAARLNANTVSATIATLSRLRISLDELLEILDALEGRIWSPWAILLVRFNDDPPAPNSFPVHQDLFTSHGSGKLNMVDFFSDMSHGKVDTSGTRLFGPYTLPTSKSNYIGNAPATPGKYTRNDILNLAKSTASAAGVSLGGYPGVVVCGLNSLDLCGWVGGMAALCDSNSLTPSLLGQEMGHGYGLDHARLQGSTADYQDPWDVMSTAGWPAMQAPNSEFGTVGPGLNAWNMRGRGWLDETRVWTAPAPAWDGTVQLRPLHRTDLPGFLAAQIGEYLVELRVPQRWDAAIPRAAVLVHRFQNNHSYLMPAYSGSQDIVEGDKFVLGDPNFTIFGYYAAEVLHIDTAVQTATVRLHQRPAHPIPVPQLEGQVFGGVPADGPGFVRIGNRIIPVPPRGPVLELVQQVARYLETSVYANGADTSLAARRDALVAIVRAAINLHADSAAVSEQPPGYAQVSRRST